MVHPSPIHVNISFSPKSLTIQIYKHLQSCLTCNGDVGSGLDIAVDTAVESTVVQLCVFNGQLQGASSIFNLVFEIALQQLIPFPPLHRKARLRQLAT